MRPKVRTAARSRVHGRLVSSRLGSCWHAGFGCFKAAPQLTGFERSFDMELFMTDAFPLSIAQLLPIVKALVPSDDTYEALAAFVKEKMPSGFPAKIGVFLSLIGFFSWGCD
jgi:hypothetical protein